MAVYNPKINLRKAQVSGILSLLLLALSFWQEESRMLYVFSSLLCGCAIGFLFRMGGVAQVVGIIAVPVIFMAIRSLTAAFIGMDANTLGLQLLAGGALMVVSMIFIGSPPK